MTVGVMLKILLKDKIRQTDPLEDAKTSLREVKKNEKKVEQITIQ